MTAPPPSPLDLANVQGDILIGLPKKTETYFFFQIDDLRVREFRTQLAHFATLVTTAAQVEDDRKKIARNKKDAADKKREPQLLKMSGVNLAFSHKGLVKLGINDEIGDTAFNKGMLADAKDLGDPGTMTPSGDLIPDWFPAFKQDIHGVILISGDSHPTVEERLRDISKIFSVGAHNATIHEVTKIVGDVRPGDQKAHEHFGFLDGVSQPAVQGVDTDPHPGQETVRQGIILLGREGDTPSVPNAVRPPWALDGSFLCFRHLFQLVPEFDAFLKDNPIALPDLPPEKGSELLGARLVGRWKSGAPINITPLQDDPELGADPTRNDNFRYDFPDDQQTQTRCPFAAHTRKTNPRADLQDLGFPTENRRIMRAGIAFGPEVSPDEAASGKTSSGRGLLFVAYQSNIVDGFQFIQKSWANDPSFPFGKPVTPGFDAIVGQATDPASRTLSGTNPQDQEFVQELPEQWVVSKGGEYFFSPSIPALKGTFAVAASS